MTTPRLTGQATARRGVRLDAGVTVDAPRDVRLEASAKADARRSARLEAGVTVDTPRDLRLDLGVTAGGHRTHARLAVLAVLATFAWSAPARADVVDEAFVRGNTAAAAGDLQAAVAAYEEAERLLPGRSAVLSFNLGTAYAQLGEVGLATYHLRRALQGQAQASEDVAAAAQRNLGIVRQRLEVAAAASGAQVDRPETWRDALLAAVGSPGFGWLALGAGWLALLVWLLRGRLGGRGVSSVVGSVIGVLVAIYLVVGGLHGYAVRAESEAPQAIALPAKLEVREGPGNHRKALFTVQGGSRVRIVDRGAGWLRIRLPDGLEGWAPQASLGELGGEVPRPGSLVRGRTQ